MKTKTITSMKMFSASFLVALLLTVISCNKKQEKSSESQAKPQTAETKVKTPNMDILTASFMGDVNAVKQHLVAGSDINVKDQYGSTPLTIAATFGKTEVAIALIDGGADLNIKNNEGSTTLHTAAFFCRTEIVKALLEKGADKTLRNNYGSTALEAVSGPFENVKPIYEQVAKQLGHFGLKLDLNRIETTRPVIAEMLK